MPEQTDAVTTGIRQAAAHDASGVDLAAGMRVAPGSCADQDSCAGRRGVAGTEATAGNCGFLLAADFGMLTGMSPAPVTAAVETGRRPARAGTGDGRAQVRVQRAAARWPRPGINRRPPEIGWHQRARVRGRCHGRDRGGVPAIGRQGRSAGGGRTRPPSTTCRTPRTRSTWSSSSACWAVSRSTSGSTACNRRCACCGPGGVVSSSIRRHGAGWGRSSSVPAATAAISPTAAPFRRSPLRVSGWFDVSASKMG